MSNLINRRKPQKPLPAILAALLMTLVIGAVVLGVGFNAFFNNNTAVAQAASLSESSPNVDPAAVEQLQTLVTQYQQRELQYQTELQQAADQLDQANVELQQYQQLVTALQDNGIIQISPDGRVFVGNAFSGRGNGEFGDDD